MDANDVTSDPPLANTLSFSNEIDIFDEFPWYNPVSVDPPGGSNSYLPLVKMTSARLTRFQNLAPKPLRFAEATGISQALIPGHGVLQSLLSNKATRISKEKISNVASILITYRLHDVLCGISSDSLLNQSAGQQQRYPIPDPGKIYYAQMANWTRVAQKGLDALRHASYFDVSHPPTNQPSTLEHNVTTSLFASLSCRLSDIAGHTIMSNFEAAALYLRILFQLNDRGDIPNTVPEFKAFLDQLIPVNSRTESWDTFFEKLNAPHTFRLPLQLALAVSGVCLFLPTQLMFKDMNRLHLLLMWQGLGGIRPRSLADIDLKIFRALADVALGLYIPAQRFATLFQDLQRYPWSSVPFCDTEWLHADPQFFQSLNTTATQQVLYSAKESKDHQTRVASRLTPAMEFVETCPVPLNSAPPNNDLPPSLQDAPLPNAPLANTPLDLRDIPPSTNHPDRYGLLSIDNFPTANPWVISQEGEGSNLMDGVLPVAEDPPSPLTSCDDDDDGEVIQINTENEAMDSAQRNFGLEMIPQPVHVPLASKRRVLVKNTRPPTKPGGRTRCRVEKRAKFSNDPPEASTSSDNDAFTLGSKRPAKQQSTAHPGLRTKRARYKAPTQVHDLIDLTVERSSLVIDLSHVDDLPVDRQTEVYVDQQRTFTSVSGPHYFSPTFHSTEEKQCFQAAWASVLASKPTASRLYHVSDEVLEDCSPLQVQKAIRAQHIVVKDTRPTPGITYSFSEGGLKSIGSLHRVVAAYDFSKPAIERETHLLIKHFLDASRSQPPKVMKSEHFPMPEMPIRLPRSIASDAIAWDTTFNQPWCHAWHEMPRNTMRFATIFNSSAYSTMQVEKHGFGVYFEIQAGSIWLIIGTPRGNDARLLHSVGSQKPRGGDLNFCAPSLDYEPIHLTVGTAIALRPGTPYFMLATDHSICRGSYWYSTSTLTETCASIMFDFLANDAVDVTGHKDSRLILRRLVHFFHMVYTSAIFFNQQASDEFAHTPNVSTVDGLENLLSLCNIMELGNVLAYDDYSNTGISEHERQQIVEARRLCRRMVMWVQNHFQLSSDQMGAMDLYNDVWMPYLARYIKAIHYYKAQQAKSGALRSRSQAQSTIAILELSFSDNPILQNLISSLANWIPEQLQLPALSKVQIQRRGEALPFDGDNILGENAADYNHYRIRSLTTL